MRVAPYQFDPKPDESGRVTHRITISGGDQLGLVARLSHVYAQYAANIVRLEVRKLPEAEGGLYVTSSFASSFPSFSSWACKFRLVLVTPALRTRITSHLEVLSRRKRLSSSSIFIVASDGLSFAG